MEDPDNIDYKTLYEKVADELTQARLAILELRNRHTLGVNPDSLRAWVSRNYLLIVVAVMLGTFLISSLQTLARLFKEGDHGPRPEE